MALVPPRRAAPTVPRTPPLPQLQRAAAPAVRPRGEPCGEAPGAGRRPSGAGGARELSEDEAWQCAGALAAGDRPGEEPVRRFLADVLLGTPLPEPWALLRLRFLAGACPGQAPAFRAEDIGAVSKRHPLEPFLQQLASACRVCLPMGAAPRGAFVHQLLGSWEARAWPLDPAEARGRRMQLDALRRLLDEGYVTRLRGAGSWAPAPAPATSSSTGPGLQQGGAGGSRRRAVAEEEQAADEPADAAARRRGSAAPALAPRARPEGRAEARRLAAKAVSDATLGGLLRHAARSEQALAEDRQTEARAAQEADLARRTAEARLAFAVSELREDARRGGGGRHGVSALGPTRPLSASAAGAPRRPRSAPSWRRAGGLRASSGLARPAAARQAACAAGLCGTSDSDLGSTRPSTSQTLRPCTRPSTSQTLRQSTRTRPLSGTGGLGVLFADEWPVDADGTRDDDEDLGKDLADRLRLAADAAQEAGLREAETAAAGRLARELEERECRLAARGAVAGAVLKHVLRSEGAAAAEEARQASLLRVASSGWRTAADLAQLEARRAEDLRREREVLSDRLLGAQAEAADLRQGRARVEAHAEGLARALRSAEWRCASEEEASAAAFERGLAEGRAEGEEDVAVARELAQRERSGRLELEAALEASMAGDREHAGDEPAQALRGGLRGRALGSAAEAPGAGAAARGAEPGEGSARSSSREAELERFMARQAECAERAVRAAETLGRSLQASEAMLAHSGRVADSLGQALAREQKESSAAAEHRRASGELERHAGHPRRAVHSAPASRSVPAPGTPCAAEPAWEEEACALFARLARGGASGQLDGHVLARLWPALSRSAEGAPPQAGEVSLRTAPSVGLAEWLIRVAALHSVLGDRRLRANLRAAASAAKAPACGQQPAQPVQVAPSACAGQLRRPEPLALWV